MDVEESVGAPAGGAEMGGGECRGGEAEQDLQGALRNPAADRWEAE